MVIGIDGHDLEGNRTGVGRYLFNILEAWEKNNALRNDRAVLFFKSEIPKDLPGQWETRLLTPVFGKRSNALFMHKALPHAARHEKIDVLWCPGYVAPLSWEKPLVLTLHDIVYEARPKLFNWKSPADRFLLKYVSKKVARRASCVLVPSKFTAAEVTRLYGIKPGRIIVTPEAADPSFRAWPNRQDALEVAHRYGITGRFLFFVGSIFTRRRIPECIRAFAALTETFPDRQFLIAGKNLTRPHVNIAKLADTINTKMKRKAVLVVERAEAQDLPALYNAAEALVWLSEYEGFGLPPLEALACGTPVITTDLTALPETVGDCTLLLHDPKDVDAITSAMRRLLQDGALRTRLHACGPLRAAQFSWDRCALQTLDAIRAAGITRFNL